MADIFQLTNPRHGVPHSPRFEIRHGKREQMAEEPGAQLDIDAARCVIQDIGSEPPQKCFEHGEGQHTHRQHVKGREAVVDQHLVDDDLREQRRQHREDLEEERGDEDFAQKAPVTNESRKEPCEAEAPIGRGIESAADQKDQATRPRLPEARARENGRCRLSRILQHDLAVAHLRQHHVVAVLQERDGGHGSRVEPFQRAREAPHLEAEGPGSARDLPIAEWRTRGAE